MDERIYAEMAAVEQQHWWFSARRVILEKLISGWHLPDDAQILEAGCGTGGNLAMLARHGQVYGMETDEHALELSAAKGCAQIAAGRLPEAIPFADKRFDLITLLDVLEHLDEDVAALRALRGRLKPGGFMLVTVPAYPFLWSRHDELHHHKRRYVAHGLSGVLQDAGLQVEYLSYFNTWLFPLVAAARLTGVDSKQSGVLSMPNGFINALLTRIFASERWLLGRFSLPAGVSLLALVRNPD